MDALYQTPLLDLFRRGEVAADIRMLAARGVLAPRAHEQLALLVWLAQDQDPAIRVAADTTLARIPAGVLARFLARPDVPAEIGAFFAGRGVVPDAAGTDDRDVGPLVEHIDPAEAAGGGDETEAEPEPEAAATEPGRESTVRRLQRLSIMEKVKAAMRGNREERMILIRDANKLVSIAVLASPRLTEQEIEGYAKMASISEDVLRVIGTSRAWTKDYQIVRALSFNPKTPIAISMGLVSRLNEKDVRWLATDRNIAEPVKLLARKMMQVGQSRKR